ncbi:MAG: hypothetical protein A3F84_07815 [Candidatus Handelsmanbacteria bacterium RIFCSPLOWO2_12_FULL_64_10]|uniref:Cohesin domain-containing protein n=1 Tax=Handelsmanbacteria sp. (strain RIFCSPLOWO2_12_FULL_64_10) TaxID=1817868 RepID=A0A1F6CP49_HANXR|nr:MAG: hypothetical protein A3F84_07815 [Candidatus Handelsmanbacteria bacterium RIFCSPLOWO2_12_FULL_64_10]
MSLDLDPADGDQARKTQGGVKPGQNVTVQLFVKGAPAVTGYTVRLEYDPKALRPGSFAAGTLVPGLIGLTNPASAGVVEVGGGSLAGTTGSGDGYLGSIPFQVQEGFSKQTYLAATQVVFRQAGGVQRTVQQRILGRLTEEEALTGDFTGDGNVNFDDFFAFAFAFGSKRGEPGFNPVFDLDNSGAVDFNDFFLFANAFGKT